MRSTLLQRNKSIQNIKQEYILLENRKALNNPVRIIALLTVISGLFALIFEVDYYKNVSMYVYAFRFFAVVIAFWVLIISNFRIGKKIPHILAHTLLLSIIISFSAVIIYLPKTLIINSQITALIIFSSAIFLTWEVKNQIVVAIYYNLVFGTTILMNESNILYFENLFVSVLFVMFMSVMSIIAVAVSYRLRKKSLINAIKLINSEKKYREIFDNTHDGMFQIDMDGKVLIANSSFRKIFDIQEGGINFSFGDGIIIPKNIFESLKSSLLKNGKVEESQLNIKTNSGEEKICRINCRLIKDESGSPLLIEGSIQDITLQVQAKEALITAKKKAEESERLKSEFLSQMSHEIRTPINSITQALEFLKDELNDKDNEELAMVLNIMDSASKRIIRTIHLILNLAEVTSGVYERSDSRIDLYSDCARLLYHEYYPIAKEKGLNFIIKRNTDLTEITADQYSIKTIFENILDNSLKFTERGSIELIIDRDNMNHLFVEVNDTGVGISEDYLPRLFKAFSQEESGYTRKFDGNGLGLALVKKYCEINNAEITIQSNKYNGTNVRISFNN